MRSQVKYIHNEHNVGKHNIFPSSLLRDSKRYNLETTKIRSQLYWTEPDCVLSTKGNEKMLQCCMWVALGHTSADLHTWICFLVLNKAMLSKVAGRCCAPFCVYLAAVTWAPYIWLGKEWKEKKPLPLFCRNYAFSSTESVRLEGTTVGHLLQSQCSNRVILEHMV